MHEKGIIHRDIKGANVLVNEQGEAKLADFGCSKQLQGLCSNTLEESMRAVSGSVPWMAPEVIKRASYGRTSDVWSVGATVIEMATAHHPWPDLVRGARGGAKETGPGKPMNIWMPSALPGPILIAGPVAVRCWRPGASSI